ncbi:50S ribosomal protein L15 [archaeon]|jgi:large subunit ribosomal protein L15|nr:50S ribosomal protein L15 [archaeon]MBT4351303.1 50S ribosomal protein L15 [archaeon]MBT4646851.1 50S ribosomal protein L15 [archaeon]MBT6822096.1 50S ribosomal protein L15 [archaeon]MBT7392585.1 50S ribosomal protein L15 [archaeon]
MQQKRKKVTRKRGTETHGHGASKKRRGAGHRGGRGNSGAGKRGDFKIAKVAKYNNKHHGKYGFTSKNRKDIKAINIHQIQIHINKLLDSGLAELKNDVYVIDLKKMGYNKLLAKGNVSLKFKITAEIATPSVIEKVKNAGGEIIVTTLSDNKENIKG